MKFDWHCCRNEQSDLSFVVYIVKQSKSVFSCQYDNATADVNINQNIDKYEPCSSIRWSLLFCWHAVYVVILNLLQEKPHNSWMSK